LVVALVLTGLEKVLNDMSYFFNSVESPAHDQRQQQDKEQQGLGNQQQPYKKDLGFSKHALVSKGKGKGKGKGNGKRNASEMVRICGDENYFVSCPSFRL
jgi:hypothetical protein